MSYHLVRQAITQKPQTPKSYPLIGHSRVEIRNAPKLVPKSRLAAAICFMANGRMDSNSGKDAGNLGTHRDFRDALGQFATGITVITTRDDDGQAFGITVNSFSSVSLDPPLILWSLERSSFVIDQFLSCRSFAVNVLAADQKELAVRFAMTDANKFDGLKTHDGLNKMPLLHGAIAHFECAMEQTYPGGDHVILMGRVERFSKSDGKPLIFHAGQLTELTSKA